MDSTALVDKLDYQPSTEKIIYIIGPGRLQNELIASCLEQKTGARCYLEEDIHSLPLTDTSKSNHLPRLVLWDCQGKDLKRLLRQLRSNLILKLPQYRVFLFNVRRDLHIEKQCVLEGIRGFFYDQDTLDIFLKGVKAAFSGELWLSREIMTQCILEGTEQDQPSRKGSSILTPRQVEILALLAVGATNEEIAERLFISPHTVKAHLYNIFKKISVPNRLQAALWAANNL
jgi:LuxR family transcriptional regulator of csgAB operon